jgi:hypothetical protein
MSNVVEIHGMDVDGVLFNDEYHKLCTASTVDYGNVIRTSPKLISQVVGSMKASDACVKRIMFATNRQSLHYDLLNDVKQRVKLEASSEGAMVEGVEEVRVGSGFFAVSAFTAEVKKEVEDCVLDTFLMSDIYRQCKSGESFKAAHLAREMAENLCEDDIRTAETFNVKEHANWAFDDTKISIVYAHIHKIMTEFKDVMVDGKPVIVNYHMYDDREDILEAVATFFETHKGLRPKRLNLFLHHYKSDDEIVLYRQLKANPNGMIDERWRESVLEMASLCGGRIGQDKVIAPDRLNHDLMQAFLISRGVGPKLVKFVDAPASAEQRALIAQAHAVINGDYTSHAAPSEEDEEKSVMAESRSQSYSSRGSSLQKSMSASALGSGLSPAEDDQAAADQEDPASLLRSASPSRLYVRSRQASSIYMPNTGDIAFNYEASGNVYHYDQPDAESLADEAHDLSRDSVDGASSASKQEHQTAAGDHQAPNQLGMSRGGFECKSDEVKEDVNSDDDALEQYESVLKEHHQALELALAGLDKALAEDVDQNHAALKVVGLRIYNQIREADFKAVVDIQTALDVVSVTTEGLTNPKNPDNFARCRELSGKVMGKTNYWNLIGGCLLVMSGICLLGVSITLGVLTNGFMSSVSLQGLVISQSLIQSGIAAASLVLGAAAVIKGPSVFMNGVQHGVAKSLSKFWDALRPMQEVPKPKAVVESGQGFMQNLNRI